MPLAYSDLTQLCSLTLAISAIGIAVDGIMVPRLEKFRDYIMHRSSGILDNEEGKRALEIGLTQDDVSDPYVQVKSEFDALQTIRDDLTETFYFDELSSYLFLGGSIVRALVVTMVGSASILIWATLVAGEQLSSFCQVPPYGTIPPVETIYRLCSMNFLSVPAIVLILYIVCCFVRYLFLWHAKIVELSNKRIIVRNSASNLEVNLKLIQAIQGRQAATESDVLSASFANS